VKVLICAARPLPELYETLVWRDGVERQVAPSLKDALREADARPDIVLVDSELHAAPELIETLRARASTQRLPVAVVLAEDTEPEQRRVLARVANVLLEAPAGPAWDAALERITKVASRHEIRVPVRLELSGSRGGTRVTGMAHNLSHSGMLVECVLALPVGEVLRFTLTVPDSETPLQGRGLVVREQRAGAGGVSCYGVRFDALEGDAGDRIRQLVAAGSSPPPRRRS
jgi:CheY-like chemotaxis protein